MRRLLLALPLVLVACSEDAPTISNPVEPSPPSSRIEVTATEYEFQGMPDGLKEGEYTFVLRNEGSEKHELYLAYITGPQSIEELLELPEKRVSKLTQAVDRAVAPPGAAEEFTAALVPGRFGYVCFVLVEGTPHAFLGMSGEFTVA